ncbi:MAG TPA: TolC family protein [Ignavibacteria bacterium]
MKLLIKFILFLFIIYNYSFAQKILSLEESKDLALNNNLKFKNSIIEIETAKQKEKSAFTNYFPNVSAGILMFKANKSLFNMDFPGGNLPVYDGNPINLFTPTQFAYFPGMSISLLDEVKVGFINIVQPIFTGGRIINGNKLASIGTEINDLKSKITKNEIIYTTEEKFWQIVSIEEKLKTIELYEELLKNLLKQVEDAYKSGLMTRNDLLKVRLKLSEVKLNKSKLLNGKELAMMSFCQHIGIDFSNDIKLKYDLNIDTSSLLIDHNKSLLNRYEYNLLNNVKEATNLQTKLKIGEYLPQIGIGINGYYLKLDKNKFESNNIIFASLSIPISNWWSGFHEIKINKLNEEIAENSLKENSDLMLLQMKKAWQDLSDAYKQILLCDEAETQAKENLKINEDSYKSGLSTLSDLLEAQALLQQAKDNLVDAITNYKIKRLYYLQVTAR